MISGCFAGRGWLGQIYIHGHMCFSLILGIILLASWYPLSCTHKCKLSIFLLAFSLGSMK